MKTVAEFLGIAVPTADEPHRMPLADRHLGGGSGSLFGGVGLGAGIVALEAVTNRPAIWATGHYIATSKPPAVLELAVELPAVGHRVTQGRVIARDSEHEVITIIGACGTRREDHRVDWHVMPEVPPPLDCELVVRDNFGAESIHPYVDIRMARGMFGFTGTGTPSGDQYSMFWAKMVDIRQDAAALAIIADYMPSAVGNATGEITYTTSLDNTIRYAGPTADRAEDQWVLLENTVEYIGSGFANGTALIWSESGDLLATASQSMTVRRPTE